MTFALITEGVSEHRVVKHIITKYFKDEDPIINQVQPKLLNDKQDNGGGWREVLKYCEREELNDLFVENDYLVIQIDTDQSETKPFDVKHTKAGNVLKTNSELYIDVVEKLNGLFNAVIVEKFSSRILFAVTIHTIECWLLPIYYVDKHKDSEHKCLVTLNRELIRKNGMALPTKDKNSPIAVRIYSKILQNWRKKEDIIDNSKHNEAFKKFIDSLENLK